ncbi:hypothetical protein S96127_3457 [Yersinia pestis]|nr:hypothetical protein S96127_3457 [Yersinia pestis]
MIKALAINRGGKFCGSFCLEGMASRRRHNRICYTTYPYWVLVIAIIVAMENMSQIADNRRDESPINLPGFHVSRSFNHRQVI